VRRQTEAAPAFDPLSDLADRRRRRPGDQDAVGRGAPDRNEELVDLLVLVDEPGGAHEQRAGDDVRVGVRADLDIG
jgi:hypothetical protein